MGLWKTDVGARNVICSAFNNVLTIPIHWRNFSEIRVDSSVTNNEPTKIESCTNSTCIQKLDMFLTPPSLSSPCYLWLVLS